MVLWFLKELQLLCLQNRIKVNISGEIRHITEMKETKILNLKDNNLNKHIKDFVIVQGLLYVYLN